MAGLLEITTADECPRAVQHPRHTWRATPGVNLRFRELTPVLPQPIHQDTRPRTTGIVADRTGIVAERAGIDQTLRAGPHEVASC